MHRCLESSRPSWTSKNRFLTHVCSMCVLSAYLYVCYMCPWCLPVKVSRAYQIPLELGVTGGQVPPCRCWELTQHNQRGGKRRRENYCVDCRGQSRSWCRGTGSCGAPASAVRGGRKGRGNEGKPFCTWATQSARVQGSTSGTGSYTPEGLYPNLESGDPAGSLSGVEIITASSVPEVDACGGGRVLKEAVG